MTPHEALQTAIGCGLFDSGRFRGEPGAIVARMGPEVRAALQQLTADDIAWPLRRDCVLEVTPAQRVLEQLRALKLRFDRGLREV